MVNPFTCGSTEPRPTGLLFRRLVPITCVLFFSLSPLLSVADAATFTVTSTGDQTDLLPGNGACLTGSATCTLRAAIQESNALAGGDTIIFNIAGAGPHLIQPASNLPVVTNPVAIVGLDADGTRIWLDGSGTLGNGFVITAGGTLVDLFSITRFGNGIYLQRGTGSVVQRALIGITPAGVASGNINGIVIDGSTDTVVVANAIGANIGHGVYTASSATNTVIGGTAAALRNAIYANGGDGIHNEHTIGTTIQGNYIGTLDGVTAAANGVHGIGDYGTTNAVIGGSVAGSGNVIVSNAGNGIYGNQVSGAVIQGNLIGLAADGTTLLGNGIHGVHLQHSDFSMIGGTSAVSRNVVAANGSIGVVSNSNTNTVIQGNYIGVKADGITPAGNALYGILSEFSVNTTIGGTVAGAGNVVASNGSVGVYNTLSINTTVQGNFIGLAADGVTPLGNASYGILDVYAVGVTIGGAAAGARNVVGNNGGGGLYFFGTNNNSVQGNRIGMAADGTTAAANSGAGIVLQDTVVSTIGGTGAGEGNLIANNTAQGVALLGGDAAIRNSVLSNSIYNHEGLGIDLDIDSVTPNDSCDADMGVNGLQNYPEIHSVVTGGGTTTITGNLNSVAISTFTLQFFSNAGLSPSGFREGRTLLGEMIVTTDGSCNTNYTISFPAIGPGHIVTATATDASGNTSEFFQATVPPAPVISSPPSETLTNDNTPTFSGTAREDSVVLVYDGVTLLGSTTADGSGIWSFTPGSGLADGAHSISATARHALSGSESAASAAVAITIDTGASPAPVILSPATGTSTNDDTPTFIGTAEAGSTVGVYDGVTLLGTTTANGSGQWIFTPGSALSEGAHPMTAAATDAASNTSPASSVVTITVDTVVPAAPTISSPVNGSSINDNTPSIIGTAEANSTVRVYEGGTLVGTTTASGGGGWSFTPGNSLSDGSHTFTATSSDAAANTSPASSPVTVTIDTVAPAAPIISSPADGSTVSTSTPALNGTAEANASVTVLMNGSPIGTASANAGGSWSFVTSTLSDGSYSFTARATDAAGNVGPLSTAVNIAVNVNGVSVSGRVALADLAETPLPGALVSDGTRTAISDGSGNFTLTNVPPGSYTLTATAARYTIELASPSNPIVVQNSTIAGVLFAATPALSTTQYSFWNGYLKMVNIAEIANLSTTESLTVTIGLYTQNGTFRGSYVITLGPSAEYDVIINDLTDGAGNKIFVEDNYGLLKIDFSRAAFSGRLSYYRFAPGHQSFEFAFSLPFANSLTGSSAVGVNTYSPSLNPADSQDLVANWLSIGNVGSSTEHFTIYLFEGQGNLVDVRELDVSPLAMQDTGAHDSLGHDKIGQFLIVPSNPLATYVSRLSRYGYNQATPGDSTAFDFTTMRLAENGTPGLQYMPAANIAGGSNFIEILNASASSSGVQLDFYGSNGALSASVFGTLPARSQQHFDADSQGKIAAGDRGFVKLSSLAGVPLVGESMLYYRDPVTRGIIALDQDPAREAFGLKLAGTYNLYLNAENKLVLRNLSNQSIDAVLVLRSSANAVLHSSVQSIAAQRTIVLQLENSATFGTSPDSYGTVGLTLNSPAHRGALFAEVLRIAPKVGQTDFAFSTAVN